MTDLAQYGTCTLDEDGCTTCGDIGIPVQVVHLLEEERALCEDRLGQQAEVAIDFTPRAAPGDVLLVHMGVAIARTKSLDSSEKPQEPC